VAEGYEVTPLRGARDNRRFARHDPHPEPNQEIESQTASVGHPAETCLAKRLPPFASVGQTNFAEQTF
jgi:hypothetical protein